MRTLILISSDAELRARLSRTRRHYSIFSATSQEEALRTLRTTEVDVILDDAIPPLRGLGSFIARVRQLSPTGVVVCLHPTGPLAPEDEESLEAFDFLLRKPFTSRELSAVLRQAEEKHELLLEVSALRAKWTGHGHAAGELEPQSSAGESPALPLPRVAKEFVKALAAGFDLTRVLDLFLDAVSEMLKPSRCALLLADAAGADFRIRAHRSVAPYVVESVRLSAESGLPFWLHVQGRLISAEDARARAEDAQAREMLRELSLLQAVLAIPLIAQGELVAILTLGQRITGVPYSRSETEVLFNLATHLATAIRDIQLHHRLQYQNAYIERILAHMSNGVVTIDGEQKVTIMNHRAEEILGLAANEILNRDLRILPSPLGDLLYESLTTGRTVHRMEIQLALRKLPLEVSTYPIAGDDPAPLGAVMVFEDLSGAKQLAAEKRRAEQFQLLSRVIARIADEIKNPLVSITTFMELLQERYEDREFRHRFSNVVGRDTKRLVEVFEKLTALVSEGELTSEVVDMRGVAEDCLAGFGAQAKPDGQNGAQILDFTDEASGKHVAVSVYNESGAPKVRSNQVQLKKALAYLIWYLIRKSPGDEVRLSISVGQASSPEGEVQLLVSSRTATVTTEELDQIFDPLKAMQESLIDLGPSVSQRIIEVLGGRLVARKGRHDVSFLVSLPITHA